jgi:hypothetical protein
MLESRELNSSDEIKEAIAKVRDELTFDEVQSNFYNWMSLLHGLLRMKENILLNKYEMVCWDVVNLKIGAGPGPFLDSL